MNDLLEVSGLNKTYPNFALRDVTFSLPEGCITGLIGANGAGKTTALRTILGLSGKSSGTVRFFGMDMEKDSRRIKERVGVVLDGDCFYDKLTLNEMKSILAPAYRSWREEKFRDYLERFSLDPYQRIGTLSKGMRIKYALALALSHQAELLILDEPTSGLDPLLRRQLYTILAEYMEKEGQGILFSTHITSDLDRLADLLILIHKGKILFQEDKDQLLERHRIVKGDRKLLTEENRRLFLRLMETPYGFTGITSQAEEAARCFPRAVLERPSIEDIMLGTIGGREECCRD